MYPLPFRIHSRSKLRSHPPLTVAAPALRRISLPANMNCGKHGVLKELLGYPKKHGLFVALKTTVATGEPNAVAPEVQHCTKLR
eukprot:1159990-Pelagomonas_calceolata.AAC.4